MSLYDDASLIVYPSGYKESKIYAQKPVPSYGAELVTNGDFSDGTNGWQGTDAGSLLSVVLGKLKVENGDASAAGANSSITTEIGKEYKISFVSTKGTAINGILFGAGTSTNSVNLLNVTDTFDGIHNGTFTATTTTTWFIAKTLSTTSGEYCYIDNVSVTEVLVAPADLTFTRASSATRVNAEGLIEEASVISPTEEVTNGNFATDSDWTKETGWSITGGNLIATSVSGTAAYQVGSGLVSGKKYQVQFEITEYTTGAVGLRAGTGATLQTFSSIGVHYADMVASGALQIRFDVSGTTTLKVSNVSVKEVITSNIPRIDYTGGGCGSLLLEKQSTNLITYSEDFSNAAWSLDDATITESSTISPSGILNGSLLKGSTASSRHHIVISVGPGSVSASFSLFVKAKELKYIQIASANTTNQYVNFDAENGTIGTVGSSFSSAKIEDYGNGWYRISVISPNQYNAYYISLVSGLNVGWLESWVMPNNTDGLYIWGAQVEESSYPTSYIISNSGSTTTRIADTFSNGGNASAFNDSEGVLYAEIGALDNDQTNRIISINGANTNNAVRLQYSTASLDVRGVVVVGGSNAAVLTYAFSSEAEMLDFNKIALKYKENDFALWVNGVEVSTHNSGTAFPTSTLLTLDSQYGGSNFFGKCQNLMVFPSALTDDELADLTGAVHQTFNSLATFYNYTIL